MLSKICFYFINTADKLVTEICMSWEISTDYRGSVYNELNLLNQMSPVGRHESSSNLFLQGSSIQSNNLTLLFYVLYLSGSWKKAVLLIWDGWNTWNSYANSRWSNGGGGKRRAFYLASNDKDNFKFALQQSDESPPALKSLIIMCWHSTHTPMWNENFISEYWAISNSENKEFSSNFL